MIKNEDEVIANSLWTATATGSIDAPPLEEVIHADLVVIGAGFTGLSTALHCVERGMDVVILEAQSPGWGASGRNGGQVIPGLKEDPDSVEQTWGTELGRRMVRASGEGPDLVFDLIKRYKIECGAVRNGWIQPAAGREGLEISRTRVEQWKRRGAPIESLDHDTVAQMVGTTAYDGGLIDWRGGGVQPLNYALGLARALQSSGGCIYGNSPATSHRVENGIHIITTSSGEVRAPQVAFCTNGYSGTIKPQMQRNVVPVRSIQIATPPLPEALRNTILPGGQVASDTRRHLLYYRFDQEGRFLIGGRGAYSKAGVQREFTRLKRLSTFLFPQLDDISWDYNWGGLVAITTDHFPHLAELAPGAHAALGFNGRGVAFTTIMGKILADRICGVPPHKLDFPVQPLKSIPFHSFRKIGVTTALLWAGLKDRMGGA